jgi:hypothetical protein
MRETDEELGEIKREIIESRALVIKTNNLTNALSADVKSGKRPTKGAFVGTARRPTSSLSSSYLAP